MKERSSQRHAETYHNVRVVAVRRKELDAHKLALACLLMSRRLREANAKEHERDD